jgi:hypothetical protein
VERHLAMPALWAVLLDRRTEIGLGVIADRRPGIRALYNIRRITSRRGGSKVGNQCQRRVRALAFAQSMRTRKKEWKKKRKKKWGKKKKTRYLNPPGLREQIAGHHVIFDTR